MNVRAADSADAARLAQLRWEFRSAKIQPVEREEAFVARCAEWMRDALASGAWRAWIAEDGRAIVGQVWAHIIPKLPNPALERECHMYISNMFVTPAARGGVGTKLLDEALACARAERVDRVILWATDRSRTMYARAGFTPGERLLELDLSE